MKFNSAVQIGDILETFSCNRVTTIGKFVRDFLQALVMVVLGKAGLVTTVFRYGTRQPFCALDLAEGVGLVQHAND